MYLECFEQREYGGLHVDVRICVSARLEQVLERIAEPGGSQVEAVNDGQGLEQEQGVAALAVAFEHDDRHDVGDHAEHDQHADDVQLDDRLEVCHGADVTRQRRRRRVGPGDVGIV